MPVQVRLLGGVDVEDHAPDDVLRLAGEVGVRLPGAVLVAPLVEAERMVQEPGDADRDGGVHAPSQAAGAHVGTIGEVEHTGIVRRGSSRKVKEKIKRSSNAYILRRPEPGFGRFFAGFRYSG
jgi:hypothetical protein